MKESVTSFRQDLSRAVDLLGEISCKLEDTDETAYVYNCNGSLTENEYRSVLGDIDDDLEDIRQKVELVKHMLKKYIDGGSVEDRELSGSGKF